jgi:hypothetical protein
MVATGARRPGRASQRKSFRSDGFGCRTALPSAIEHWAISGPDMPPMCCYVTLMPPSTNLIFGDAGGKRGADRSARTVGGRGPQVEASEPTLMAGSSTVRARRRAPVWAARIGIIAPGHGPGMMLVLLCQSGTADRTKPTTFPCGSRKRAISPTPGNWVTGSITWAPPFTA